MSLSLNGGRNGHHVSSLPARSAHKQTTAPSVASESMVDFCSQDGLKLCGAPVRLTQHSVVFEIHGGNAVLRLSEVLADFQISNQGQIIYSGRAVICNLMDGGSKVVCEATLDEDCWTDFSLKQALQDDGGVEVELGKFLQEWQRYYKISPEFKIVIADIHCFLGELQVWLDRLEMATKLSFPHAGQEKTAQLAEKLEERILSGIRSLTDRLEQVLNGVERELMPSHWVYCRRMLHPFTLSSPFMHRTFVKPLGYAGDYEMVDMMFHNRFEGNSLFAQLLNSYALQLPPVVAHRNRIQYLTKKLQDESLRLMAKGSRIRVFSLGCGPAQEVQSFLEKCEFSSHAHFTLADFNQETLDQTGRILQALITRLGRRTSIKTVRASVQQIIKDFAFPERRTRLGRFDFIYCAGLFDYLPDRTCHQIMEVFFEMLQPGGLLVATNVDNHEARNQMECFLDWQLIYRNHAELQSLSPEKVDPQNICVKRDPSGVNVFLEIRK